VDAASQKGNDARFAALAPETHSPAE